MAKITLGEPVLKRWAAYHKNNPVWTLHELVTRLLNNHFDEADAMLKSIEEQEQKKGRHE